ncbi:MAG: hypothetical protein GQ535_08245 [Rhodobacteraceae bacterium]|nr:hypothetical protein [Paracoccaceae bacterium]
MIARYFGGFQGAASGQHREQWLFLVVFAAMYAVFHIVVFFYEIERMPI